jgi:hypothetical protein
LNVSGCVNVAPGVVAHVAPLPCSHAQLDMVTVTEVSSRDPGASWISSPTSSVERAWKPRLGTFGATLAPIES